MNNVTHWTLPEWLERTLSVLGLIAFSPVLLMVAVAIVAEDGRPILFRQVRVGRYGAKFHLLKFRSMRTGVTGTKITAAGDARVSRVGRIIRKYKLDELPQAWNVVRGEMSLIGPRPEVPSFVDLSDRTWTLVLQAKPGISDVATLLYRNEEELLRHEADPESYYRDNVLPAKLRLNLQYMQSRTWVTDLRLLFRTVLYSFYPASFTCERARKGLLEDILA